MESFAEKFAVRDKVCWLMSDSDQSIYTLHFDKGLLGFCCRACNEKDFQKNLFQDLVCFDNKLMIIPNKGQFIHLIDLTNYLEKRIEIKDRKSTHFKSDLKFHFAVHLNGHVYVIPYSYPAIIHYDTRKNEETYIDEFVEEIEAIDKKGVGMFYSSCLVGDKIYLTICGANSVFCFDTKNEEYHFYKVGDEQNRYVSICFDNDTFWLMTKDGKLVRWNKDTGETQSIFDYDSSGIVRTGKPEWTADYSFIFSVENEILIFNNCYQVVKVNSNTGSCGVLEEMGKACDYNHVCVRRVGNSIISYCKEESCITIYNCIDKRVRILPLKMAEKIEEKKLQALINEIVSC